MRRYVAAFAVVATLLTVGWAVARPRDAVAADKVAAPVRAAVAGGGRTTVWVTVDGRADLGGASGLADRAAKGAFVHRALTAHADRAQAGIRDLLRRKGIRFQAFWIANAVRLDADRALIEELARRRDVRKVDADPRPTPPKRRPPVAPVDPAAPVDGVEWNVARIGAPKVWKDSGTRGEGIVVGVIDTGVRGDHPALAANYRGRASNGTVTHDHHWYDPSGACAQPCDTDGHGTHVAGIAVGHGTDGSPQIGVAPGARWIAARGCGVPCRHEDILAAGQWMLAPTDRFGADPRPDLAPDVINNSWLVDVGPGVFFREVIDAWVAAGILPVFAIGNDGLDGCGTNTWPASFPGAYAVGNTDARDRVYDESSRARAGEGKPDISAPGTGIRSSDVSAAYRSRTGTSMAAPHVTGAVALLWSAVPSLEGDVAATRALLDRTATDLDERSCGGTRADNPVAGEGLMDVSAAVRAAPPAPVGSLTVAVRGAGGRPVPDATVTLTGPGTRSLATDAAGGVRLDRARPGRYTYRVTAFGHPEATGTVEVAAGRPARLDVVLTARPTGTVTGVVRAGGAPAAGAVVTVAGAPVATRTGADGRYTLTLPVGPHDLDVRVADRCALAGTSRVDAVPGGTTADVALPPRTDGYGHTCTTGTGGYRAGGTRLGLTGDTGASVEVALPFPVRRYGQEHRTAWVGTDGLISFGGAPEPLPVPWLDELPQVFRPVAALYPFHSTLTVDAAAGVYLTASATELVVEWRNVAVRTLDPAQDGGRLSVSATLRPDGTVTFAYRGVSPGRWAAGVNAVIGMQPEGAEDGFAFGNLEEAVTDGLSVTVRPPAR